MKKIILTVVGLVVLVGSNVGSFTYGHYQGRVFASRIFVQAINDFNAKVQTEIKSLNENQTCPSQGE